MGKQIPRLVIAATQSGGGKTTVATGLMAAFRGMGLTVQPFKVGPDYLDPTYHRLACGRNGENLDTWLVPPERLTAQYLQAANGADIAVIEGVMGLYDGGRKGVSSTAEIAKRLQAPVVLVLGCRSVGESAAAAALGFRAYDPDVNLAGVILNRLGSATHEAMIREAMERIGMPVFGAVHRTDDMTLPSRHLGLVAAAEGTAEPVIRAMGEKMADSLDLTALRHLAETAPALTSGERTGENTSIFEASKTGGEFLMSTERFGETVSIFDASEPGTKALTSKKRVRIAVARDEAFSFYYPSSLAVLENLGADLVFFSPLHDTKLPQCDGLILGGGYPELYAEKLASNTSMRRAIRQQAENGMPVYAECGGYMYLLESLTDLNGKTWPMTGVFPGRAVMTSNLHTVGYIEAKLTQNTLLGKVGSILRGHEFHFSQAELPPGEVHPFLFTKLRDGSTYAAGQIRRNVIGSYLHLHFVGCPQAAMSFLEVCRSWDRSF